MRACMDIRDSDEDGFCVQDSEKAILRSAIYIEQNFVFHEKMKNADVDCYYGITKL